MTLPSHRNNRELIDHLIDIGALRTLNIIDAFMAVDRAHFVLPHHKEHAYADNPLPISEKATISQPYTVACMLEWLQPQE
jgi:protein-L-isoaspartate(D-aspartate) O-methyltransferase